MGRCRVSGWLVCVLLVIHVVGCAVAPTVPVRRLLIRRAMVDPAGLAPVRGMASVKATCAPPARWDRLVTQKTALFTHEQWRSPTAQTAVGVIYARLPSPLSADAVAWFAKREYRKHRSAVATSTSTPATSTTQPSMVSAFAEWKDAMGRPWFEGEDSRFHVRGYVVASGLDVWFVYTGYRLGRSPLSSETAIAERSAETFVPARQ